MLSGSSSLDSNHNAQQIFRGVDNGHVYAIDAESGKTVWDVTIADPARGETIPMAPVAWNGMVFVGNAGGDNFAVAGRVYALDAATAGKDGLLYGVDRGGIDQTVGGGNHGNGDTLASKYGAAANTLILRYQTPVTTRLNTGAPLTARRFTRFCPGSQGGAEWNGPAYHPELNLIFVPTNDWCTSVKLAPPETLKGQIGKPWTGSQNGAFGKMGPSEK